MADEEKLLNKPEEELTEEKSEQSTPDTQSNPNQEEQETSAENPEEERIKAEITQKLLEGTPYKSVEDLKKSTKELQGGFTKTRQELAQLRALIEQSQLAPIQQKMRTEQQQKMDIAYYMKKYPTPDGMAKGLNEWQQARELALRNEFYNALATIQAQLVTKVFRYKYPEDYKKYKDDIKRVLQNNPVMAQDVDALDKALAEVKKVNEKNISKKSKEELEREVLKKYGISEKETSAPTSKKNTPEEQYKKLMFG